MTIFKALSSLPLWQRVRATVQAWLTLKSNPPINESSAVAPILQHGRMQVLFAMNRMLFALCTGLWLLYTMRSTNINLAATSAFGAIIVLLGLLSLERVDYKVRAISLGVCIYASAIIDFTFYGIHFIGTVFLFGLAIYTLTFSNRRIALYVLLFSSITLAAFIWMIGAGVFEPALDLLQPKAYTNTNAILWPLTFAMSVFGSLMLANALLDLIQSAWQSERESVEKLAQKSAELNISLEREQDMATALQRSLEKEMGLNALRSQVVTTVSHEFRTPLTVINTSADLLHAYADRMSPEKRHRQFERIKSAVQQLDSLLKQVTAVEGARSGLAQPEAHVTLPFNQFSAELSHFILNQFDLFDFIEVESDSADTTPISVDRSSINRLCQLIVGNSVKFDSTRVSIDIAHQRGYLIVRIEDNGIGVPP